MHDPSTTPDQPQAATLEDLKQGRVLRARLAPSGKRYDIRPLNLERFALTGGMPTKLRAVAMRGAAGVNEVLGADDEKVADEGRDVQEWLDRLVAETIVSPSLMREDAPGVPDPDRIDLLPPVDYRWACAIALNECDEDGEGARLWGREPLSRWATFRRHHSCPADCQGCSDVVDEFSAAV